MSGVVADSHFDDLTTVASELLVLLTARIEELLHVVFDKVHVVPVDSGALHVVLAPQEVGALFGFRDPDATLLFDVLPSLLDC